MEREFIIENNVFMQFVPLGWFDGLDGFLWNLHQLLPFLPRRAEDWVPIVCIWAVAQLAVLWWLFPPTRRDK